MIFLGELMTKTSQCGVDGWRAILGLALACAIVGSWGLPRCIAQEPLPGEDPDLKEIVSAASAFDISIGADNLPLEFKRIPVLRWPNATRLTPLGGTFIWTRDERPEAIACLWRMGNPGSERLWFAFQSLSQGKVVAKKGETEFWSYDKPGLEFKKFEGAPQPAETAAKRIAQMKELAGRFRAEVNTIQKVEKLSLMPTHLYRYKSGNTIDGALFAFVQGNDPEVILHLEAQRRKGDKEEVTEWQYAFSRRSAFALEVTLDDEKVWSADLSAGTPTDQFYQGPFPQQAK